MQMPMQKVFLNATHNANVIDKAYSLYAIMTTTTMPMLKDFLLSCNTNDNTNAKSILFTPHMMPSSLPSTTPLTTPSSMSNDVCLLVPTMPMTKASLLNATYNANIIDKANSFLFKMLPTTPTMTMPKDFFLLVPKTTMTMQMSN